MTEVTDDKAYDAITVLSHTLIRAFEQAGDISTAGSDYNLGQRVAYLECARLVRQYASGYLLAGKPEKASRDVRSILTRREQVAELFGINPESVRSTLGRAGIIERRGYPRAEVLELLRKRKGRA